MATPFFSVIITTFNRAALLKQALKSLQAQTFRDFEVFVYDDASTDNTQDIVKDFQAEPGWKFVKLAKNSGYPYAKNLAFRELQGKYVAFLDSDDVWLPNKLQVFHEYITTNPAAGFIFSNGFIHQDGYILSKMFNETAAIPSGMLPAYMAVSNHWLPYVTTNVALKAEAVKQAGFYREDMAYLGDTEYFARIMKNHATGVIPEPLSIYRIHGISITQNRDKCIDESVMTLDSTNPPKDIYDMLYDLIYYSQSVVLIKNGQCGKAREYLGKLKLRTSSYYKSYIFTFIPPFILGAIRFCFKKLRIAKLILTRTRDFIKAENLFNSLKN